MSVAEKIVELRGRKYLLTIEEQSGELCWNVGRENAWGGYAKIPAMSRTECNRFPKTLAIMAQAFLAAYKVGKK